MSCEDSDERLLLGLADTVGVRMHDVTMPVDVTERIPQAEPFVNLRVVVPLGRSWQGHIERHFQCPENTAGCKRVRQVGKGELGQRCKMLRRNCCGILGHTPEEALQSHTRLALSRLCRASTFARRANLAGQGESELSRGLKELR